jgi:hypothetical protein
MLERGSILHMLVARQHMTDLARLLRPIHHGSAYMFSTSINTG